MKDLADAVLDYIWFLEFSDEEELDPDRAVKLLEYLGWQMQEIWTEEERQALSEAAARRLNWLQAPDEFGDIRQNFLTDDQTQMLESLSQGRFDGYGAGENEDQSVSEQ